jgi:heme/copper-type cytochrome/quinol oxidase subunit 3
MPRTPPEQLRYAKLLDWGTTIGFVVLAASAIAYFAGWLPSYVPVADLPRLWKLPVRDFVATTGVPTGWRWIAHLRRGEFASLAGIVILASSSLVCLGAAALVYARRGDRLHAALAMATIAVLVLAAVGIGVPGR